MSVVACHTDTLVIPAFVTRRWIMENLDLTFEEVKRLDYEGFLKRHPGFGRPVKYTAKSVRDFIEGKRHRG